MQRLIYLRRESHVDSVNHVSRHISLGLLFAHGANILGRFHRKKQRIRHLTNDE